MVIVRKKNIQVSFNPSMLEGIIQNNSFRFRSFEKDMWNGIGPVFTHIHTYFIAELISNEAQDRVFTGVLYLGAFVIFNFVIGWSWITEQLKRRKRYHQLCQQRVERSQSNTNSIEIART